MSLRKVVDISKELAMPEPEAEEPRRTQASRKLTADQLLRLLEGLGLEVFRTPEGMPFFSVRIRDIKQTLPLDELVGIARQLAYSTEGCGVSAQAVEDVKALLQGRAYALTCKVWVRLASTPGHVFIDLVDGTGEVIDITPGGWTVIEAPAGVVFFRPSTMKPLPRPVRGQGSLECLRELLHLDGDAWRTAVAFLLTCVMPPTLDTGAPIPRCLLLLTGEHQAGKTTRAEQLVSVIDPRVGLSVGMPREARDLAIHAQRRGVLLFDNLSGNPPLADDLCRLLDGAGFVTRELFTNSGEVVFSGSRSIIITGIDAAPSKGDLASRCLHIDLPPLPEGVRATPDELAQRFRDLHPGALAELCDLAVGALAAQTREYRPATRLAGCEKWVAGCEQALGWNEGDAARLFQHQAKAAVDTATEGDPIAQAILTYLTRHRAFEGNAQQLLDALEHDHKGRLPRDWPETPKGMAEAKKRALPGLRALGVEYTEGKRRSFRLAYSPVPCTVEDD